MRKYFERAYHGFCSALDELLYFAQVIAEAAKMAFVCITLPLWFVPYAIYKKIKER